MVNVPNSSVPIASQFAPGVPWFQFFNDLKREVDGKYDTADISSGWQTALAQTPTSSHTPTLTSLSNLDATTAYSCRVTRIGNFVRVSGKFDADATASATATLMGFSLPIASNFTNESQCSGVFSEGSNVIVAGAIKGDTVSDRATFAWRSASTSNTGYHFMFEYEVL